ncbi:uncharacterized protein B0I36DRAFT_415231 [Microdochium trichocladiopsis]|uniref:Uncharacterized protein n=1 Tax=Microdochium trichocladiopsis TaxID=1682393 RepID=A0A9P8Y320_9PEZI|nr:uncharacterized protein B0I36DRAFT_415231 [Microdochium trichocladiopsis]KAH7026624.1 hypothetical protein B0I36DRAFT_415231 [Microdochium trichocladiopsis]
MADISRWSLWYDHSSMGPWGWVITVPNEHGFYITSFLSTILTIAGASAWNIISLLIHAHMARGGPTTDIFGLQQQVSLRNSPSGFRSALDAISLFIAWRHTPGYKRGRRTLMVALPGVLIWGAFFAASLLTSMVANEATDRAIVRAKPDRCGFVVNRPNDQAIGDPADQDEFHDLLTEKWTNDTVEARAYALSMRDATRTAPLKSIFMKPKLEYKLETNVPCALPNSTYCLNESNATISLTSERLDSHLHLGINAPPSDRIALQHKATCSVVENEYFVTASERYISFRLGPTGLPNSTAPTYRFPIGHWNQTMGYQIDVTYGLAGSTDEGLWHPVEGIARTDADQGIIFLSQNGVRYPTPVKDLLFRADLPSGGGYYEGNVWVNTLVCAEQYRWCKASDASAGCTEWGGAAAWARDATDQKKALGLNAAQRATAARISFDPRSSISIMDSVVGMNTAALFANSKARFNVQSSGLDDNQWHLEVAGWFETALADYQATTDEYVRKSSNLDVLKVLSPFDDVDELITRRGFTHDMIATLQSQCNNQLIDDAAHIQNFSMVGVIIIIGVSVLLVLTSFWFVEILDWLSDLRHRYENSRTKVARQADEKLHLLRYTIEGTSDVPKHWRIARWTGVPVLIAPNGNDELTRQDCTMQRPTMKGDDELARYHKGTEEFQHAANSESSAMLNQYTSQVTYIGK